MSHAGKIFVSAEEVYRLRDNTIGKLCNNACNGTGTLIQANLISDCICLTEYKREFRYTCAGIPKKYWSFTLDDLLPKFTQSNKIAISLIQGYCGRLKEMIDQGVGLYLQGKSGLAKSALAFYMLREAQLQDYECYCIRMSQLTKTVFESLEDPSKREFLRWLKSGVQLLCIDEIDKDYKISSTDGFAGNQINEFFGDIYNSRKAIIVTSNLSKKDLLTVHAPNVVDRLSELADVVFVGESYRKPDAAITKILSEAK